MNFHGVSLLPFQEQTKQLRRFVPLFNLLDQAVALKVTTNLTLAQ
jgi:hypothetical protein